MDNKNNEVLIECQGPGAKHSALGAQCSIYQLRTKGPETESLLIILCNCLLAEYLPIRIILIQSVGLLSEPNQTFPHTEDHVRAVLLLGD